MRLKRMMRSTATAIPGLRSLLADRARLRQEVARLHDRLTLLTAERADLRTTLARASLSLRDWQPAYIQNKPMEKSDRNWDDFFDICRELGAIQPNSAVLDVGCGVGGVATRFAQFLGDDGRYDGLDVDPRAIAVCNAATQRPNVRFTLLDVRNDQYNPNGEVAATDVVIPFPDASYDVAIARSLFTHMYPEAVRRYTTEIARTLRVGGRAIITLFVLNEVVERRLDTSTQRSIWSFPHRRGEYRVEDQDRPLTAVALQESFIRDGCTEAGLSIVEPIRYGSWSGGTDPLAYQDIIVAQRR